MIRRVERSDLLAGAATAAAALVAAVLALQLWRADLRVPFSYIHDGNLAGGIVKTIVEHGWHFTNSELAAPFGQRLYDFPLGGENAHFLVVRVLALVSDDWAFVLNAYFLLTFPFVAAVTFAVLRLLTVSRLVASCGGVLFALLPYHFVRGEPHLTLSAYAAVPVAGWLVLTLLRRRPEGRLAPIVIAALVVGFGGTYYAMFALVLLGFVAALRVLERPRWTSLRAPAIAIAVIVGAVLVNNIPTLVFQWRHGGNEEAASRYFGESDIYGLRIAALFLPVRGHRVDALAELEARSRDVPYRDALPGEEGATLGVVLAAGLVVTLGSLALFALGRRGRLADELAPLGVLNGFCMLAGTIGGLSTFLALAGFLEIRAWARLAVFIAFFSLVAVCRVADHWLARQPMRRALAFAGVVTVVALVDVTSAAFVPPYRATERQFRQDAAFVAGIERILPSGAEVFQLPAIGFPEVIAPHRMVDYDPLRMYLHSDDLSWSYGGIKGRREGWASRLDGVSLDVFLDGLAVVGFDGLEIDTFGLSDDTVPDAVATVVGQRPFASADRRFLFFDLRSRNAARRGVLDAAARRALRATLLEPVDVEWAEGFSFAEGESGTVRAPGQDTWRWAGDTAVLDLINPSKVDRPVELRATIAARPAAGGTLVLEGPGARATLAIGPAPVPLSVRLVLPPGRSTVRLSTDIAPTRVGIDGRDLSFRVVNLAVVDAGAAADRALAATRVRTRPQ